MSRGFILKNGSLLVSTEAPGGIYNSEQLSAISKLSEGLVSIVKATEDQRLALVVNEENLDQVAQELSGVGLGVRHYLDGVHQATSCIGKFCSEYQQDALKDAVAVTEALREVESQNPVRIAMNGCGRCCNPCHTMDISVVGDTSGYRISLGGKSSIIPELAQYVAEGVPAEELPGMIKQVVDVYNRLSQGDDSLGKVIEQHGLMQFADVLAPYSQDASASPGSLGFASDVESTEQSSVDGQTEEATDAGTGETIKSEDIGTNEDLGIADGPEITDDPSLSTAEVSELNPTDPEIDDLPLLAESELEIDDLPVGPTDSLDNGSESDGSLDASTRNESSLQSESAVESIKDLEDHEEHGDQTSEGESEGEEAEQAQFEEKLDMELGSQIQLRDAADDSNQQNREEALEKYAAAEELSSDEALNLAIDEASSEKTSEIIDQLSAEELEPESMEASMTNVIDSKSAEIEAQEQAVNQELLSVEATEVTSEVSAQQNLEEDAGVAAEENSIHSLNSTQARSTDAVDSLSNLASNVQAFPKTTKAWVEDIDFAANGSLRIKFTSGLEVEFSGDQLKEGLRTLTVAGHQIKIEVSQQGCEIQVGGVRLMLPMAAA